jgi:hypothetical protein
MTAAVIRYQTKPEAADKNQHLIENVFAELASTAPPGLHYSSFRLADGVTFVHVAVTEGETNPLGLSGAFAEFQSGIRDRVVAAPEPAQATVVGSYRFFE